MIHAHRSEEMMFKYEIVSMIVSFAGAHMIARLGILFNFQMQSKCRFYVSLISYMAALQPDLRLGINRKTRRLKEIRFMSSRTC